MVKGTTATKEFFYAQVTVSRHGSAPAIMCMVTMHPDRTMFFVRGQLASQLAPKGCSESALHRMLHKVPDACTLEATHPVLFKLKAMHAIQPRASHAQLFSMATCKNLLKQMGTHKLTLDSLDNLTPAAAVTTPTVGPQAAADSMQASVRLPAVLPKGQYSKQQLSARYGLNIDFAAAKLLQLEPLRSQVEALHDWMTEPINLARGKQKYVTEGTWLNYRRYIYMFLGFCHRFRAVPQPSLEHFLDGHHLTAYADFLIQRVSLSACCTCFADAFADALRVAHNKHNCSADNAIICHDLP